MTNPIHSEASEQSDTALLLQGVQRYQQGLFTEASQLYLAYLQQHPNHGDTLNLLALAYQGQGDSQLGLNTIQKAILLLSQDDSDMNSPSSDSLADWYNTQSTLYFDLSLFTEAIASAESGLKLQPHHPDLYQNKGLAQLSLGKSENNPDQKALLLNNALSDFQQALQLDPSFLEAALNLANTYCSLEAYDQASSIYQQLQGPINANHPLRVEFIQNYCHLLHRQKQYQNALQLILYCIQEQPTQAIYFDILGTLYTTLEDKEKALKAFLQAVLLDPNNLKCQYNLGTILFETKQYDLAEKAYLNALQLNPEHLKSLLSLAELYQKQNRYSEALALLEKARELDSDGAYQILLSVLLPVIYQNHDEIQQWRKRYTDNLDHLLETTQKNGLTLKNPVYDVSQLYFFLAYQGQNDKTLQKKLADIFYHAPVYQARLETLPPSAFSADKTLQRKLRVGFLSRFLRPTHTIGKLWGPLLMALPSERYETFLLGIEDEALRQEHWFIKNPQEAQASQLDHQTYVPLPMDNIPKACQLVQEQKLDLILFCDIGMEPTAYFMAFSRMAPVQCVTWGHPITTGLPTMDYFLSSQDLDLPESAESCYTEELVRFPHVNIYYQKPQIQSFKSREDIGLSENKTLYVCAQSLYKFHPDFDLVLKGILEGDPNGEIILINGEQAHVVSDLRKRWERTIGPFNHRIKLIKSLNYNDYLNLMNLTDVTLDPFPFGGGNTQLESFAFGTPVVTKPGRFLRGRITHALYQQMATMEPDVLYCVAKTPEDYIQKALELGLNPDFRKHLGEKINTCHPAIFETMAVIQEFDAFCQDAIFKAQFEAFFEVLNDSNC